MKRHWYAIEISYMKDYHKLFSRQLDVGVICQSDILRQRTLKKQVAKFMLEDENIRPLLCNGEVKLMVTAYLGKFHNSGTPNFREWIVKEFGDWITGYFIQAVGGKSF